MGADGFGWVQWGAGARGDTKTRQAKIKIIDQGMFSHPMAGEISPDMMFCGCNQNGQGWVRMGANWFGWVGIYA